MKKYAFYQEMFFPGEVYEGCVTVVDWYKLSVTLKQGGHGIVYSANINYDNKKFTPGQTYDFEVIGFNQDGLISLVPAKKELFRLDIRPNLTKASVIAVSNTAVALKIKGDVYLYKSVSDNAFFELLEPESEVLAATYSPDGLEKNFVIADIAEFSAGSTKIMTMDYSCRQMLNAGEKQQVGDLTVGQLKELIYEPLDKRFYLVDSDDEVIVNQTSFHPSSKHAKYLGRVTGFSGENIPCINLIYSWT